MKKLPAGLIDKNVEVFDVAGNLKASYNGKVYPFLFLPKNIIIQFYNLLIDDDKAREEFEKHNIKDMGYMLEEYARCNFGGFDNKPDLKEGKFQPEFWACPKKGECKYNEKLCVKLRAKNGMISRKEISVMSLLPNHSRKEIASILEISESTVNNHCTNIHAKLGVTRDAEVVSFAFKHNLTA